METYTARIERNGVTLASNVIPAEDDTHAAENIVKVLWMEDRMEVHPGDLIEVCALTKDGEPFEWVSTLNEDDEVVGEIHEGEYARHRKQFGVERFGEQDRKVRVVPQ